MPTQIKRRRKPVKKTMATDPVCGADVKVDKALKAGSGRSTYSFCSEECRLKFQAYPSGHPAR